VQRRTTLSVIGAALGALLLPQGAEGHVPGGFSLRLETTDGVALRNFHFRGTRWVQGVYGEPYQVRLFNSTPRRVEAVVSIDGRDAINGRRGSMTERGYVLAPYGSMVIRGFRQSLSQVAEFRFTAPSASYSARMGTPENVGVIGVAFFSERQFTYRESEPQAEYRRPAPSAEGAAPGARPRHKSSSPRPAPAPSDRGARDEASNLGTEYGDSRYSPVSEVYFERANARQPDEVLTLRYDDATGLRRRGVLVEPRPHWPSAVRQSPEPFPDNRFAPAPP
jgi:hypothetical protein